MPKHNATDSSPLASMHVTDTNVRGPSGWTSVADVVIRDAADPGPGHAPSGGADASIGAGRFFDDMWKNGVPERKAGAPAEAGRVAPKAMSAQEMDNAVAAILAATRSAFPESGPIPESADTCRMAMAEAKKQGVAAQVWSFGDEPADGLAGYHVVALARTARDIEAVAPPLNVVLANREAQRAWVVDPVMNIGCRLAAYPHEAMKRVTTPAPKEHAAETIVDYARIDAVYRFARSARIASDISPPEHQNARTPAIADRARER